jgi:hypothetical protein
MLFFKLVNYKMTSLNDTILQHRPNLSPNTVKTYSSIIRNIYLKFIEGESIPRTVKAENITKFFEDNCGKVLTMLNDVVFSRRKTILAALVALLGSESTSAEDYRKQMIEDADKYNAEQRKQKKTDTQQDNWISQDQVINIYKQLEKDTKHLFSKPSLKMNELQQLQNYIILSVYTLIPPRRLMDYTEFKLRNINTSTDNYMKGNSFIFNNYKTKNKYGQQDVKIPVRLRNILQKWAKKHNNDYLLFSEKGTPLPQSRLTQKLNKIFGKNISVNMLRHIFISDNVLEATPALQKLEQVAEDMGHSVTQQQLYKKV